MKKNINRTLITLLLLCTLLVQPSCGFIKWNNDGTAVSDTSAADTSAQDSISDTVPSDSAADTSAVTEPVDPSKDARGRLASLPERDLSSSALIIAVVDANTVCPNFESTDAVIIARSDVRRAVEEKYNAIILQNVTDAASMLTAAKEAYNSDMYYADLISIPQSQLGAFHAEGILANMNSLPFTDYTAEYYDQSINGSARLGGIQFAVSGAANLNPDYLSCIYFNRTLADQCGLEDVYTLVKEGKWTWDKLGELALTAKSANSSVTGLGAFAQTAALVDLAASSQDIVYVSGTESSAPIVDFLGNAQAERAKKAVDTMYRLLFTDGTYSKTAGNDTRALFSSGTLLFTADTLDYMTQISSGSVEWGILPMPKQDEAQNSYISPLSADAPIFCALANTPSYETSGLLLEALNAAAHDYIADVYMNDRIDYHLRDTQSVYMLEYIIDGAASDFAHMFASGIKGLENASYKAIQNAVTTRSTLDQLYRNNKNAANRALLAAVQKYE